MKKTLLLLTALLVLPLALFAAERIVVLEIGTGTWCTYCPGAAMGADDLHEKYPDEVLVVEYHDGDDFANTHAANRLNYYAIGGYPTAWFDGVVKEVGGSSSQSKIGDYEPLFLGRRDIESPVTISLEKTYSGAFLGNGTLTATIENVSEETVGGFVHFVVTETHIPHEWRGLEYIDFCERDMLPNATGELITIPAGDTVVLERDFTVDPGWPHTHNNPADVELGCFLQQEDKEILQAASIMLVAPFEVEVSGSLFKNEDGILRPWADADFVVTLHNIGEEAWESVTGVLSTEDQYVTVDDPDGSWGPADADDFVTNDDDPFYLSCNMSTPEGHQPDLFLTLEDDYGQAVDVEFKLFEPVAVAEGDAPGFSLSVSGLGNGLVALSIPVAADAEISLIDASGRRVETLHKGELNPGLNLISLPDDLASGAYFVKAEVGSRTRVAKLLILH